jgi:hypothetical protein
VVTVRNSASVRASGSLKLLAEIVAMTTDARLRGFLDNSAPESLP